MEMKKWKRKQKIIGDEKGEDTFVVIKGLRLVYCSHINMELNSVMLAEFLCSLCSRLMHPPIRLCVVGHCFCEKCDSKYDRCPSCKRSKGKGRNFLLERLYEQFLFPCDFRDRGCMYVEKGSVVKKHLLSCQYDVLKCPLTLLKCNWRGNLLDVFDHAVEHHQQNTVELTSEDSLVIEKRILPSTFSQLLIKAYSRVFKFTWSINSSCTSMTWALVYLGVKENAEKYYYCLEFYHPLEKGSSKSVEVKCELFEEYDSNNEMFAKLCDKEAWQKTIESEQYHYKIEIREKEQPKSSTESTE
ncbi:hypothetical protein FQA39_LY10628 [Lamprigera yunnana]|nr:hypothetical protein FQA39_LY10628 [Lamprigera yunnana]